MIKSPARLWPALAGVLWSAWCGGLSSPAWSGDPAGAPGGVNYLLHVKPLLRSRCVACHGAIEQEGGLRLDAAKLILAGGDDGAVVVPGQGAGSRLIQRVSAADPAERMPPKGAPLATHEIELLKAWIDAGAPSPEEEPITQNPREHWAFQPVRLPPIPAVQDRAWAKNAIDQFVLAKLEARNWRPNPAASRPALLRRIYLDLLGLPPTPAEQEAWLESAAPDADEQLVAALLQNDAYGERYARHWLDVVRYADSNGYERDAAKPAVWRYRDYVIRALNQDLPFNRFLLEQMAGDELADADASTMIATGFHRLGPWDDEPADPAADRFDQLDDLVSTASQAFLGLTLGCARCHDHKFDPLTQRDYYGLLAVFQPLTRPRSGRTELTLPMATWGQQQLMSAEAKQAAPQGYFLQELPGPLAATHILVRGSPHQLGAEVAPSAPEVLCRGALELLPRGDYTSRRRLSFAQWLTAREHPLTARVIVNRVWQWHFGSGLVRTSNDFGLNGERPTHPELLDYLAWWFVHDADWSLKKLHALIVNSSTYQQSREDREDYAGIDPENRLLWRRSLQRLECEPIRDSMLAVSGQMDRTMYGPPMYPFIPAEALESHADKSSIWPAYDERAAARRTVYAFTKRSLLTPMLEALDLCDTTRSSASRNVTTVPTQALTLYNGAFAMQQARHLALRLQREAGPELDRQIDLAWRLALCRPPSATELNVLRQFVADEQRLLKTERGVTASPADLEFDARVQLGRVLFNLNEFVYPD